MILLFLMPLLLLFLKPGLTLTPVVLCFIRLPKDLMGIMNGLNNGPQKDMPMSNPRDL